jgi:hypothetical protein
LEEAFQHKGRMPLRRWLESTWLKLGGANTLISAGDNRDIQAFFDLGHFKRQTKRKKIKSKNIEYA